MDFGRLPESELDNIDFTLSPDPVFNKTNLNGQVEKHPKIFLGCTSWGRPEWVGKIYPKNLKEKDFLTSYGQHFNSIELNATHYKNYDEATIKKWANKVGEQDFIFCPKMYQGITHRGTLADKAFLTTEFLRGVVAFQQKLGPIFIQLSDHFSPNRKNELFTYLKSLPTDLQFFVELRHPDWFAKDAIQQELFKTLTTLNIGAVITDTAGRRDCAHMYLTLPKVFIRFVGNSLHQTDYARSDAWVERIKYWRNNGLKECYFFLHMPNETTLPELSIYMIDKLNSELGLNLVKPTFVKEVAQGSLF